MDAENNLMNLSLIQRRNGVVSQSLDLELVFVNKSSEDLLLPCYTSLKDILPSTTTTVESPSVSFAVAGPTIMIRNRLVKQAACAYLQPSTPTPSSSPPLLRRLYSSFLGIFSTFFDSLLRLFPSPREIFKA
ncbi:hypothetical protein V5N11_013136 [Cardamine amara subsp. amara]|uniref:Uncharacterized protein n=1 Tax=Cardamine amara subsp. amara TaxID=228776 RepID=A0ABD1AJK9_CARAN